MYTKLYEVWTIIFKVIAMSGYSDKKEEIWLSPMTKTPTLTEMSKGQSEEVGVYFRLIYLHAVVTFYTYLLGISSDEIVTMAWNVDIMFLQYLY